MQMGMHGNSTRFHNNSAVAQNHIPFAQPHVNMSFHDKQTGLFGEQTVHDEHQHPLKAVEDCEDVGRDQHSFVELKTAEDPHGAEHAQLSNGSYSECPVGGDKITSDLYSET